MDSKLIYEIALSSYRRLRQTRNRLLNLIDRPVVVLIYHRVNILPADRRHLAVSPENFQAHMHYLKQNCRIVRFEEDWSGLKEPAVAVTFDDGYADNVLQALPILESTEVPATFFISTGSIGTLYEFHWDELERILLDDGDFPGHCTLQIAGHERSWPSATSAQRLIIYNDLLPEIQRLAPKERETCLDQLRSWAGIGGKDGREENRPLSHDELRLLGRSRWATVGAHTVSHAPLSSLSAAEQKHEIATSRRYLEDFLQEEIPVFSYPFGARNDYTPTSVNICREAGFKRVAANFPGQAHRWTDPMQIPRQLVRNWDGDTFAAKMKSFWT